MVRWSKIVGFVFLPCLILTSGRPAASQAASSATIDLLSDNVPRSAEGVESGNLKSLRERPGTARLPLSGNPLWSVPLSVLTVTRERPLFSPSRRPPRLATLAPPVEQAVAPPPTPPAEPDRPPLALIGAVVGDGDAIAVFLDRSNQKIVRLRQGDSHAGWQLSSVQGREVTLKKADRSEVLALQRQEGPVGAPAGIPGMPVPQPVSGATDGSYAPFTPRSTPKNGESDDL
jgi:general secretion pathway protein N